MEREVGSDTTHGLGNDRQSPGNRETLRSPILQRALIFVFAYVLLLALIGIIYKDELSWSRRTAYLLATALLCLPVCFFYGILTTRLSGLRTRVTGVFSLAGSALLSAGSATVLVYGVDRLFREGFMPNRMRDLYVLGLAALLVVVSVGQYPVARRSRGQGTTPGVEEAASRAEPGESGSGGAETPGASFFRRLPAALGRDVVYLKMNDHYVEVFTTAGHGVVLMRLGDAVAELEGLGIRVHRSYWVARDHAERLVRRGQRSYIRVTGGRHIPVSRTYRPAIADLFGTNGRTG